MMNPEIAGSPDPLLLSAHGVEVPSAPTLDRIVETIEAADQLNLSELEAFDTVRVRTQNTVYRLTILDPSAGKILVQGGRHFPTPTRARFLGSSVGRSVLKTISIVVGLRMGIAALERCIVTSPVTGFEMEQAGDALMPS
jgi:hypothetical protein